MTSDKTGEEKPVRANVAVQTSPQRRSALLFGDFELIEGVNEKDVEATEPVSVGVQTEENLGTTTVVYYEPEMKFLRREDGSENNQKGVEAEKSRQTQQTTDTEEISSEGLRSKGVEIQPEVEGSKSVGLGTQEISTIIYYEPEMKFLTRAKSSESVGELKTREVQTQSSFQPEMKPLREDESGKRGALPNNEDHVKEIQKDTKDKSVGTEPETLEDSERDGEEAKPTLTETRHTPTSMTAIH